MMDYIVNKDNINYHLYLVENKYIYNIENLESFLPTKIFYYILKELSQFNQNDYETAILTIDDQFNFTITNIDDLNKNHPIHLYAKDMLNNGLDRFIYDIKSNFSSVGMSSSMVPHEPDDVLIQSVTDLLNYIIRLTADDTEHFIKCLDSTDILIFPFYIHKQNLSFSFKSNPYNMLFVVDNKTIDYNDITNKYYNIYLKEKYHNEQLIEALYLLENITNKKLSDYSNIEGHLKNIINNRIDSNTIEYETKLIKMIVSIIIYFVRSQINEIVDKTSKYTTN
jgi:hypothetical protein